MKGCRPLDERELKEVVTSFGGTFVKRDRALFLIGTREGYRVSEILSIQVRDVLQNGRLADHVTVARRNMKGKTEGRTVPLHPEAREAIAELLAELKAAAGGRLAPDTFLFQGRRGDNRPISRVQAWRVLKRAFAEAKLTGPLGTHSMKKTFAQRLYKKLDHDLVKLQAALGHRWISSTAAYVSSFANEEIDRAILGL